MTPSVNIALRRIRIQVAAARIVTTATAERREHARRCAAVALAQRGDAR